MFGVAATACGSDDPAQGTVTTANAALVVNQLGGISASMSAMNGPQAFASFRELMYAGQSFVVPRDGSPPSRGFFATTVPVMATGAAVCTATSCTFNGYGSFTLAIFTTERLDGTITRSGDTTTFDLTYSLANKLGNLAWTIGGSVATTATRHRRQPAWPWRAGPQWLLVLGRPDMGSHGRLQRHHARPAGLSDRGLRARDQSL